MSENRSYLYRILLITTTLLCVALFFWGLGSIPLLSFNEARRAIPAANMIANGDWLLPRLNGELYITKPPLLYWLSASLSLISGLVNEWTARIPSALSACATAWLVYVYAKRHYGQWSALFALQIIVANAGIAMLGRQAGIEMLLTFLCFSALICALKFIHENSDRKWLLLSYFLLGLAVLTKGPIALLFVTLPLLVDALYQRKPRHWLALRDPVGWLIFLVIGSSWYIAVSLKMGSDIWHSTVHTDMLSKIYAKEGEPVYNYILWIAADFFPSFFLLLITPFTTWRLWRKHDVTVSLLIAFLVPFLIYTAFSDKHAKYLLPAYPVLAILLGHKLETIFKLAGNQLKKLILVLSILLPLGYMLFYAFFEYKVFHYRFEALPQITTWLDKDTGNIPIYGYIRLDERLFYYANRDFPIIDNTKLESLKTSDAILLVENSDVPKVQPQAQCTIKTFKPYLKRKGVLVALGFGNGCNNAH
jgi:4-amino-4-deoxy-L-arabinose transferase-like glycosyltransferase